RGVGEVAADPVLRAAPGAGPRARMAGRAIQSRAVRGVVERGVPPGTAGPAGGRRRPLALMTGEAIRGGRAAGEVGLPAGPGGEGTAHVTGDAVPGRRGVIELDAGWEGRVRGRQQRRLRPLRRVTGNASTRRERRRGVGEVAADPVLSGAPGTGPRAGVASCAVQARAVRRKVERRGPPGAADPSGGRRRPLALLTGQTAR